MISSELKYKITLQSPVKTNNEYGTNQDIEYTDYKVVYAGIKYVGGNKNIQNAELFMSQVLQFKIRYRDDFDTSYRIKYDEKYYNILNINEYDDGILITAELVQ